MWRSDIFGLLGFPPFVPAADVGVADALNVDSRIWVDLTSPLNGFGLGWEYSAGPFRTWFSYRISLPVRAFRHTAHSWPCAPPCE
jgi:hypothetical protein